MRLQRIPLLSSTNKTCRGTWWHTLNPNISMSSNGCQLLHVQTLNMWEFTMSLSLKKARLQTRLLPKSSLEYILNHSFVEDKLIFISLPENIFWNSSVSSSGFTASIVIHRPWAVSLLLFAGCFGRLAMGELRKHGKKKLDLIRKGPRVLPACYPSAKRAKHC